ncbi:hypothetical protein QL285_038747 [Trifolium repens]|nr:hypothetical protein QL285_038747 [Trifolium repens]
MTRRRHHVKWDKLKILEFIFFSEKISVITNDRRNTVVAEFLKEQVAFFLQMQMQNSKENQVGSLFLTFLRDSLSLYEEA